MTERLLRSGIGDGAMFHAYHAYECAISAFIAAQSVPVPKSHTQRFTLFTQFADPAKPYAVTQTRLRLLTTIQARHDALYYDEESDVLPADRFSVAYVGAFLPLVRQFIREVWREVR